jgi:hypothetical protein
MATSASPGVSPGVSRRAAPIGSEEEPAPVLRHDRPELPRAPHLAVLLGLCLTSSALHVLPAAASMRARASPGVARCAMSRAGSYETLCARSASRSSGSSRSAALSAIRWRAQLGASSSRSTPPPIPGRRPPRRRAPLRAAGSRSRAASSPEIPRRPTSSPCGSRSTTVRSSPGAPSGSPSIALRGCRSECYHYWIAIVPPDAPAWHAGRFAYLTPGASEVRLAAVR